MDFFWKNKEQLSFGRVFLCNFLLLCLNLNFLEEYAISFFGIQMAVNFGCFAWFLFKKDRHNWELMLVNLIASTLPDGFSNL